MERIIKTVNFDIKDIDETTASFWAVASDEGIDRDGDIIEIDAWDLRAYKRNPTIPLFHNYHEFPVARADKIKVSEGKLMFKPVFAVNENPQAKIAFDLYKGGYMSAFSVGFMPLEWAEETRKDGRMGRNYTKVDLLEISAVLVPANPNALIEARSKGINVDLVEHEEDKGEDKADGGVIEVALNCPDALYSTVLQLIEDLRKEVAVQVADLIIKYNELQNKLTSTPKDLGLANVIIDLKKLIR
jgi:HK97 family phage prohead protease